MTKPNIVFILTDGHRYDAMGFLGHPFLETPNLDRIAGEGMHFENAYVTTSLCSPSRASILTGIYVLNHQVADKYYPIKDVLPTLAEWEWTSRGASIPWQRFANWICLL